MWIRKARLINYKSFDDSGWIELGKKFNFFVGRNNSGKTALLETFKLNYNTNMPHRDASIRKTSPNSPRSIFEIVVNITAMEAFDALQGYNAGVFIPIDPSNSINTAQVVDRIFHKEGVDIDIKYWESSFEGGKYPSDSSFYSESERVAFTVSATSDRRGINIGQAVRTDEDHLPLLFNSKVRDKIFVFNAERFKSGEVSFNSDPRIAPDASNLARALFEMEQRTSVWEVFNRLVNQILPNIKRVVTVGVGQNIQIRLWPVDPETDRDDLLVKLADSGTGVGQILAILCAVLTYESSVICIDEPGNFLHPGAVKELMKVLNQYDHQYIITTHSIDAIAASNPEFVYRIDWENSLSKTSPIVISNIEDNRMILAELGISISDVFGVQRVIWVEGQTEEVCFPIVIQDIAGFMPSDLAVLRVRSVEEIVRKQGRDRMILEIYSRLSNVGGIVPRDMKFCFDRESRSQKYIEEVERESGGKISFMSRRTYENYLIDIDAIAEEINAELALQNRDPIEVIQIKDWFDENGEKYNGIGSVFTDSWIDTVNAPKLMKDLFQKFSDVSYRKIHHSPSLTRRCIQRNTDGFIELRSYIEDWVINV